MYFILHDESRGIAVLVDPAGPHALGPAIGGEGSDRVLEAFVAGLDQDPSELTAFELASMWAQFLAVMGYTEETDPTAGSPPAGVPATPEGDASGGVTLEVRDGAGEGTAVLEAGRDEPPAPPAGDWPACANCGATKRDAMPDGSTECSVCGVRFEPAG